MKIMKKILCTVLVVVLCLTSAPLGGFVGLELSEWNWKASAATELAPTGQCGDNVYWNYDSATGELVISGTGEMWYENVLFSESNIKSLVFEDGVTSIYNYEFYGCTELENIILPNSLVSIGEGVFYGCSSLTNIVIPEGVMSIDSEAFYDCSSLSSITIPDSVTSIAYKAFYNTAYFNDADNWENNVLYIDNHLITVKTSIGENYVIKNGTVTIADFAFYNCSEITNIIIPDSVTSIGDYAFEGCSKLTNITIPESVVSIGVGTFYDCIKLSSITIPDSVTSIGADAFYGCSELSNVTIPDSVTSIGGYAFYNTAYFNNTDNWENEGVLYIDNHFIAAKRSIDGSYAIKNGTVTIAGNAFYNCSEITNIIIPDSVTSIGDSAFVECSELTNITIPNGVTSIGAQTFYGCSELSNVTIPDSVTSIGAYAFEGCSELTNITIPESVISIDSGAFYGCSRLSSITIPDSVTSIGNEAFHNTAYAKEYSNWNGNCLYIGNHLVEAEEYTSKHNIKNGTVTIANRVFSKYLKSITIPASITNICDFAFYYCDELKDIYFLGTLAQWQEISIGRGNYNLLKANLHCEDYDSPGVPDEPIGEIVYTYELVGGEAIITEIDFSDLTYDDTFEIPEELDGYIVTGVADTVYFDYSIKNIVISKNIRTFALDSIPGGLEKIIVDNDNPYYSSDDYGVLFNKDKTELIRCPYEADVSEYVVPDSVKVIGDNAFWWCYNVAEIILPDDLTTIGEWAFYGSGITEIELGKKITYIGSLAFAMTGIETINIPDSVTQMDGTLAYAISLKSATIGSGVTSIPESCFMACGSLSSVAFSNSVKSIELCAFDACEELSEIYFYGTKEQWESIIIEDGNEPLLNATIHFLGEGEEECEHNPIEQTIPATCTVNGMKFYICLECGETIGEPTIIPAGHTPGEWVVTAEPTYEKEGKRVKYCTVCGEVVAEETLPKLEKQIIEDKETGVAIEIPTEGYDGEVEIEVEESFDGTAFNILDAKTGAVQQKIYDIKMLVDGEAVQPNGKITVKIPLPVGYNPNFSYVYYVNTETGAVEKMEATYEDGYMVFETDHFSYYAVIAEPDTDNCSCNCHAGGIKKFFFKFLLFFQKIFKKNKQCKCGVGHY